MTTKKSVRELLSPGDVLMVVYLLKRFLVGNKDITGFLNKIDEPAELDQLYDAIAVLTGLVK